MDTNPSAPEKLNPVVIWIVIIVALLIAFYFAVLHPSPVKAPVTGEATSTPTQSFAVPTQGPYIEHAKYYDVTVNYATSTSLTVSLNKDADAAATALMRAFVSDQISQFKKDGNFDNLTASDIETLGFNAGRKYTLNIIYLIASSKNSISYIFTIDEDTGGAHGNRTFKTFTFDSKTGKSLQLGDLFKPGTDYLGTISKMARTKLPGIIGQGADTDMITSGTMPDEKNFANFFIDRSVISFVFAPYQVAPYSSGTQTLQIGLSEFGNSLKPDYKY